MLTRRSLIFGLGLCLAMSAADMASARVGGVGAGRKGGNGLGKSGIGKGLSGPGKLGGKRAGGGKKKSDGPGKPSATGKAASKRKANPRQPKYELRIRHGNGFQEKVGEGRYEMRDNRGRLVTSRRSTASDYLRLRKEK